MTAGAPGAPSGSLFVQVVIAADLADVPTPLGIFVVLVIMTIQVTTVCV